jgi:hypothetical protein
MSSVVSIFFQNSDSAGVVSTALQELLNCNFELEEDSDFSRHSASVLGVELILIGNHGLVDDCGIPFSHFQYELDLYIDRSRIDSDIADIFHQSLGRYLFEQTSKKLGWKSALVFNLQRLISISPDWRGG